MKKDDSILSRHQLKGIRRRANLLLQEANAIGRFPTPVADLVEAANLQVDREISLSGTLLAPLYQSLRPGLIKKAVDKVWGILDIRDRRIYLDGTIHPKKKVFLSVHEIAHYFLPWQRDVFSVLEDSNNELDLEVQEDFEREANVFACEVLFQLDNFEKEAADYPLEIQTPLKLSKRYGASFYSTARRFVSTHKDACALLVFDRPHQEAGIGYTLSLRRYVQSRKFTQVFGSSNWAGARGPGDLFTKHKPFGKFTKPTICQIRNVNNDVADCILEAFDSGYQIFYLIYPVLDGVI